MRSVMRLWGSIFVTSVCVLASCKGEGVSNATLDFTGSETGSESTTTGETADTSTSETGTGESSSEGTGTETETDTGPAVCGNGVVEGDEPCDDGNREDNDGCTSQCVASGTPLWNTYYDGFDTHDTAHGIALDPDGNVLIVGAEEGVMDEPSDALIAKFSPTGEEIWSVTRDAGQFLDDFASGVASDTAGNVIISGLGYNNGSFDVWVAKYDPNGQMIWEDWHNGPLLSKDEGLAVVTDGDDIIVGGYEFIAQEGTNAWLRRYSPDGTEQWTTTVDGSGSDNDQLRSLALDQNGDIVAAGFETPADGGFDIWLAKFDSAGNVLWQSGYPGPFDGSEELAEGVGVDPDGNILATGIVQVGADIANNSIWDIWVGKFDGDGMSLWETTVDGPLNGSDYGEEIAADSLGNIVVVGSYAVDEDVPGSVFNGLPVRHEAWVQKYDPDGGELFTHTFGPQNQWAWLFDVVIDSVGDHIFIAGQVQLVDDRDVVIRKLVP